MNVNERIAAKIRYHPARYALDAWICDTHIVRMARTGIPDLAAFLIIQMETLYDVATKIGKSKDAGEWKKRAAAMKRKLTKELWRADRFVSLKRPGAQAAADGDSLINFVPVVLGKRLPKDYRPPPPCGPCDEEARKTMDNWRRLTPYAVIGSVLVLGATAIFLFVEGS